MSNNPSYKTRNSSKNRNPPGRKVDHNAPNTRLRSVTRRKHEGEGKLNVENLDIFQTKDKMKLIAQLHDIENLVDLTEHFITLFDDKELGLQKQINTELQKKIQELEDEHTSMNTKIREDKTNIDSLISEYDLQINDFNNLIKQKDDAIKGLIKQVNNLVDERSKDKTTLNELEKDKDMLRQTLQEEREETKITVTALQKTIRHLEVSKKENKEETNDESRIEDECENEYVSPRVIINHPTNELSLSQPKNTVTGKQSLNITSLIEEIRDADQSHYEVLAGVHYKPTAYENAESIRNYSIDIFEETLSPSLPTQNCSKKSSNKNECLSTERIDGANKETQENIYLIGDSIAASIKNIIVQKSPRDTHIIDFTRGGATIGSVDSAFHMDISTNDKAVMIVGTNDLFKTQWDSIKKAFESMMNKLQRCKTVYIIQICRRYDIPRINKHITKLNTRIKHLVKTCKNVQVVNTKYIKYDQLSEDGIHLNNIGKNKLAHKIVTSMFPGEKLTRGQLENVASQIKKPTHKNSTITKNNKNRENHTLDKKLHNYKLYNPNHTTNKRQIGRGYYSKIEKVHSNSGIREKHGNYFTSNRVNMSTFRQPNTASTYGNYVGEQPYFSSFNEMMYYPKFVHPPMIYHPPPPPPPQTLMQPATTEWTDLHQTRNIPPSNRWAYQNTVKPPLNNGWVCRQTNDQIPNNGMVSQTTVHQQPFDRPLHGIPTPIQQPNNQWVNQQTVRPQPIYQPPQQREPSPQQNFLNMRYWPIPS